MARRSFDDHRLHGRAGRTAFRVVLWFGASWCLSTCLFAQQSADTRYLVFDAVPLSPPVPLAADTPPPAGQPPYLTEELLTLPRSNAKPVQPLLIEQARQSAGIVESTGESDVARYEASLKELERQGNAYSPALAETLLGLASVYEALGNYAAAVPLYERASHITRVNFGLFSLEQEPIIKRLFNNFYMQGDLVAADQQQEYLFYLQRRAHGDNSPLLLPALHDYAEWNIRASRAELLTPPPPPAAEEDGANTSTPASVAPPVDMVEFRLRHLLLAQAQYLHSLQLLSMHFGPDDPRLPETERALAITSYLYTTQAILVEDVTSQNLTGFDMPVQRMGFNEGRRSLERRIEYLKRKADTPSETLAAARLDLVDWMIATRNRSDVRETFRLAYEDMKNAGASQEALDALFHPPLPVSLPGFLAEPYSRAELGIPPEASLHYQGFIDVSYTVSALGETSAPRLLFRSDNTPDNVADILLRLIRRGQYRPRLLDGEIITSDQVYARYYYAY